MTLGKLVNIHPFSYLWCVDKYKTMLHYNETLNVEMLCKCAIFMWKTANHLLGALLLNPLGVQLVLAWNVALAGSSQPADTDCTIEKEASVHSHYMHYRLWEEGHIPVGSPSASGSQPDSSNLSTYHLLAQLVFSYYIPNPSNFNLFGWLFRYLIYRIPNHQFD